MRRNLVRLGYCSYQAPFVSPSGTTAFSSTAGGGGRGRGRGSEFSNFQFTKEDEHTSSKPPAPGFGHGQGGGHNDKPLSSSPIVPPFSPFIGNGTTPSTGRGRGRGLGSGPITGQQAPLQTFDASRTSLVKQEETSEASSRGHGQSTSSGSGSIIPLDQSFDPIRKPSFVKEEAHAENSSLNSRTPTFPVRSVNSEDGHLSTTLLSALSGAGRGKPTSKPPSSVSEMSKEENRHVRVWKTRERATSNLSPDEATKKAVGILGGDGLEDAGGRGRGGFRGRGFRGRGSRGRGLQAWGGRGGGRGGRGRRFENADDDYGTGLYLGDEADGKKLSDKLGPDIMNRLVEGFDDMTSRVLPSPVDDAYVDALHTNLSVKSMNMSFVILLSLVAVLTSILSLFFLSFVGSCLTDRV